MLFVPIWLAVDTDNIEEARRAAEIYLIADGGESTTFVMPPEGVMVCCPDARDAGEAASITIPPDPVEERFSR